MKRGLSTGKIRFAAYAALLAAALCALLSGCAKAPEALLLPDVRVRVDETSPLPAATETGEAIAYSFEGEDIALYNGCVRGMTAGREVLVTARAEGREGSFLVTIAPETYAPEEDEADWFSEIGVEPVEGLADGFAMGMDLSTLQAVLEGGGRFYNEAGERVSVFRILRDSGVNWVRLRLWNAPYQLDASGEKRYYGGGNCDLATVSKLAADCKALGFSLLLNFHYSDFWADPTYQIIPKAWSEIQTPDEMALAIYDFTYDTLETLAAANASPDMVQLGNELTSGMLLQRGGAEDGSFAQSGYSGYVSGRTNAPKAVRGSYSGRGAAADETLVSYVRAGADAVNAFSASLPVMLQLAKDMTDRAGMTAFYHTFDGVDYDVIGLSYYPRWHGSVAALKQALAALSAEFPGKRIAVVELSYAFTLKSARYAQNQFGGANAAEGYAVGVQGQADLIRDVIAAVASVPNGFGVFYWESAWLPVEGAGWAAENTLCSWANQALFSYDGRALPSLAVFRRVRG